MNKKGRPVKYMGDETRTTLTLSLSKGLVAKMRTEANSSGLGISEWIAAVSIHALTNLKVCQQTTVLQKDNEKS